MAPSLSPPLLFLAASGLFGRARLPLGILSVLSVSLLAAYLLFREDGRAGGAVSKRVVGSAPPESLAAIRIVLLGIMAIMVVREDMVSTAHMPRSMIDLHEKGVMAVMMHVPGFASMLVRPDALLAFKLGLLVVLSLGVLGLKTRVVLPLSFAGYLLYGGILRLYVHFFHQGLLPLYVLAVLMFTPCADALSLDRILKEREGLSVPEKWKPEAIYGFSRWAIFALIGLCYFSAGVAKLRLGGLLWWEAENMRSKIWIAALESKMGLPFGRPLASGPDWLLAGLGLLTLVIELGMVAAVFSRRSWAIIGPCLFGLHAGILVSQEILFIDLLILPVIFWVPHHLGRALWALRHDREEARAHLADALSELGFRRSSPPRGQYPGSPNEPLTAAQSRRARMLVYGIAAYVPLMVFSIEQYPSTAWQMYAYRFPSTEVAYLDVAEHRADGAAHRPRLDEDIGLLIDRRFHWAVWAYFEEPNAKTKARLDNLFAKVIELRKGRAPREEHILGFSIDRRTWDRKTSPSNPREGRLLGHYSYPDGFAPPPR